MKDGGCESREQEKGCCGHCLQIPHSWAAPGPRGEGRCRELSSCEVVALGVLGTYGGLGMLWGTPSRCLLSDLFYIGIHLRFLPRRG